MKKEGKPVAANVEKLLASGKTQLVRRRCQDCQRPRLLRRRRRQLQAGRSSRRRVVGDSCEKVERSGEEEFRSLAGRSRRWCRLHRVPLQDELAGRRHRADDHLDPEARRRGRQLRRFRHHQRRSQLLRRRQHHDAADGGAGRRVGRSRDGHPPVPEHDAGHQVLDQTGRGRAVRHDTWWGNRDHAARRGPSAACRAVLRPGRGRRRPAARRRRLQGDDDSRHPQGHAHSSAGTRRERRTDGSHEAGVRNRCHGEGFDLGCRGAQSADSCRRATTSP